MIFLLAIAVLAALAGLLVVAAAHRAPARSQALSAPAPRPAPRRHPSRPRTHGHLVPVARAHR